MNSISSMILKRLAFGLLTLWAISLIIFFAIQLLPGDLAQEILGQSATPESVAAFRAELGLDRPATERYLHWLAGAVTGDFGTSLASGRQISELISQRLSNTVFLAVYAAVLSIPLAVSLGMLAALYRNSIFDRLVNIGALAAVSFPEFFLGYILIALLAQSGVFPSTADLPPGITLGGKIYHSFLPALTLTLVVTAHIMRMTRATIVNLLALPYIEMAHLKGIKPSRIIFHHALPNALAPIINIVALNMAYLITGVVVVEVVFVFPGLGQLMVDSVSKRDVTVVQAVSLIFASAYILLNLAADVLATLSNPRLRHNR
ncbi:ABC transporter permease [Alcaligenaceae bacterium CGII-47]|nr:ABC transporter permease [Alcaligenaceae bacterium CGII-47]